MISDIPLPKGFNAVKAFPRARERLLNCMYVDGGVIDTPGVEAAGDGVDVCRAAFRFQDLFYHVSGTELIRIDQSGGTEVIGSVPGSKQLSVDTNFTHAVIVNAGSNGDGYVYDGTDLTKITHANFVPAVSVTEIDALWFFIPLDGGPGFHSAANDPFTIDADYFFDAETLPDRNIESIRIRDVLYILGENSIEPFRNVGNLPAPFLRVTGGAMPVGYLSAKVEWGDMFAFIGREKDQAFKIFAVQQGRYEPISNPAVNELLATYSEAELIAAQADRFQWLGFDVLLFHMKRHTLGYHNSKWFFMQSGVVGYTDSAPWRARHIRHWRGTYWCGDALDGRIGRLVEADTEYEGDIQRLLETFFRVSERSTRFTINELDVGMQGSALGEGRVGLSMSRDGLLYGPTMWEEVPATYGGRVNFSYPGGLGDYESFAGIRLSYTDKARFAADVLTVDVE